MTSQIPYRLALAGILLAAIGFGAWLGRRFGRPANAVSRSADGIVVALGLAAGFLLWPPLLSWSGMGLPAAARWVGAPLLAGGGALAMWARFTLGRSSTVTAVPAPDAELVTDGPYRWLRHPIYSAGLLILPGGVLLTDSWPLIVAGVVVLVVLDIRTRREERLLLERFGESYRDRMAATRRWLPRIQGRPARG
jgi:protein-S-isoprenylcysteine O-methyltransferase Ste14